MARTANIRREVKHKQKLEEIARDRISTIFTQSRITDRKEKLSKM